MKLEKSLGGEDSTIDISGGANPDHFYAELRFKCTSSKVAESNAQTFRTNFEEIKT